MPILPENKARYPKDWPQIRERILKECNNKCELCGVENHSFYLHEGKVKRVVLTIAHLDHVPENCERKNLKALCQKCHNRHDATHRAGTRKKPKRIQRRRTKGWRMPPNTVYVGRPSKWGNPFTGHDAAERYKESVRSGLTVLTVNEWVANGGDKYVLLGLVRRDRDLLEPLRGKNLACFCPLNKPCHADILLEIVGEAFTRNGYGNN